MERAKVYDLINEERTRQINMWGGIVHDKQHSPWDWTVFITKFIGKLASSVMENDGDKTKDIFIKIAALCVAAVEAIYE